MPPDEAAEFLREAARAAAAMAEDSEVAGRMADGCIKLAEEAAAAAACCCCCCCCSSKAAGTAAGTAGAPVGGAGLAEMGTKWPGWAA